MFAWIRDNAIVVLCIVAAIVFVALVILILRVLKKSKARKEERAIMAAEIPITDAEEDADFSAPARVREKGTSELSWLKPLPLKEETEKETEDPAENVGAFDNEKEIKEMAKEKTFCKNSVTSPKGILTQKEQGIRPALFALMCDKREKSCKSALLAVVADQIESQQNNSSYDSDDVSNTHDKILLNISYSLRVWNPVKIY